MTLAIERHVRNRQSYRQTRKRHRRRDKRDERARRCKDVAQSYLRLIK